MAKEWNVTTEQLKSSASVIEEKTAEYNTAWGRLYTELENMKGSQWSGVANEAFNARLEGFRNDFQEMSKVLMSYAEYLRTAATNYESAEEAIKAAASRLNIGN